MLELHVAVDAVVGCVLVAIVEAMVMAMVISVVLVAWQQVAVVGSKSSRPQAFTTQKLVARKQLHFH